jgi:hypothetical protein
MRRRLDPDSRPYGGTAILNRHAQDRRGDDGASASMIDLISVLDADPFLR